MIKVTNNMKDFIEVQKGPLYVYGAGQNGYHVGNYLNRCGIEWEGYIDQKAYPQGTTFNEHLLFSKDELVEEYGDASVIRLLITAVNYQSILEELLWLDCKYNINALCLVPVYEPLTDDDGARYNINKCLAFFRNKLFVGDVPTIISNDCTGGMIYNLMDMLMLSPTVNTGMSPSDFIKFCKNTKYYLNQELNEDSLHYTKAEFYNDTVLLSGKIADITIYFAHLKEKDRPVERWNLMRKKVNWNRMIYVMREPILINYTIPLKIKHEFMELEGKKLFYSRGSSVCCDGISSSYLPIDLVFDRNTPTEKYFNILEWINS